MDEFRADLHCHSDFSDGTDSPLRLLRIAADKKLQGLSITDHDTLAAYTPELFLAAQKLSISLLVGVEISSGFEGVSVHILGYGSSLLDPKFLRVLKEVQKKRAERNLEILRRLKSKGKEVLEEELMQLCSSFQVIGRPHIAQVMVLKGYVSSTKEAFDLYLKEGGQCFFPGEKFSSLEVIEAIHTFGGKAILAHPHFFKGGDFLEKLLALPFDGYECYYAKMDKQREAPWIKKAREKDLLATGGSDYHGNFKPYIELGASWVGKETFEKLCP